jgi:hypothetical protein
LHDDFYLQIIKHEKFNPRLIEWLSTYRRVKDVNVGVYRAFVQALLRDPSEIWRHAYEQEISHAGRSLLLALFTLNGRAGGVLLESAFTSLHRVRAERYGYQRRPEDFRATLRELAGAFIKPASAHSVEFLDPSVLDLLNAILRGAPDNAVDLILGAASFDQIDRVWSFAVGSQSVMSALAGVADLLAAAIAPRLHDDRRIDMGERAVGYRGATFERRLSVLIAMTDRWRRQSLLALVMPLVNRLLEEWHTEAVNITDGVRTFDGATWPPLTEMSDVQTIVRNALIEEAATGCRSDELRELISVLDLGDDANSGVTRALRQGFQEYRRLNFRDDLRECRSSEQFDGLIQDLELFKTILGVETQREMEDIEETKAEFEEQSDAYADNMHDEWKERWQKERADEGSVRNMFDSLSSDRD